MKKGIQIWYYEKNESLDSNEHLDINISINSKFLYDIINSLVAINLSTDNSITDSIKLESIPQGCPYNIDYPKENYSFEYLKFYKKLKINRKSQNKFIVNKLKNEVVLCFSEVLYEKFIFKLIRSQISPYLYDHEIEIDIIEISQNNIEKNYKGNIVFWGNKKGKPLFIG